ncbi:hypothetical protein [Paenibacillus segetis]|uniref:Uncharacterized protein n=1 Tax=Paenibacillus segetis TaxID=1325360 RepID=A0ABQ1YEP4_9BACL|nr:hypothetical protein [Paenibacillus segetis]GGH22729.1 hypothetical protein GCM10008013_21360 [Paenibacillus segetis]
MSRIVFWDSSHGGSAQIAASVAITLSLHFNKRLILANGGRFNTGFEEGFPLGGDHSSLLSEYGMDALLRLAACQRLSKGNISDYTLSLLRGRLDLVSGRKIGPEGLLGMAASKSDVEQILLVAEQYYDLVLLHSMGEKGLQQLAYNDEDDVLVVVLCQSRVQLDTFFSDQIKSKVFAGKKLVLAICQYDRASRWTLQNIKRRYNCEVPMYGIPYHTGFADAWNARDILSFFRRHRLTNRRGPDKLELVSSYHELSGNILQLAGSGTFSDRKEKGA